MSSPRTAMKSSPRSPQLEKARAQQRRPNAAQKNNNKINKLKKKKKEWSPAQHYIFPPNRAPQHWGTKKPNTWVSALSSKHWGKSVLTHPGQHARPFSSASWVPLHRFLLVMLRFVTLCAVPGQSSFTCIPFLVSSSNFFRGPNSFSSVMGSQGNFPFGLGCSLWELWDFTCIYLHLSFCLGFS